ncbi:LAMI_0E13234g1_1 [Lachancea mirantina]|uniref:Endosomal/vacuolar adapter protein YPT35 n=1 Tax=Lachancea mirantina TaxID=1230905 RepID=A0A1G4JQP0_9SACH|nr:LAMI_0E13234g1_1 [Lachancea mirantina]
MGHTVQFLAPEPISLVNNEPCAGDTALAGALRFKHITVGDCTIVNTQWSRFAVWQIELVLCATATTGGTNPRIYVYKRYTDFVRFRARLLDALPASLRANVPDLPPKVSWLESWQYDNVNLNNKWLARRRAGLDLFLNQVLLNDTLLSKAIGCVREFLEK